MRAPQIRLPRFALVGLVALAAGACTAAFPDNAAAADPACSEQASGDAAGWRCTFADEFDGSQLDSSKWVAQQTDGTGFTSGQGPRACYVDDERNVSVSGGTLKLTARREAAPFICRSPHLLGDFETEYTSGMVSTAGERFSQTYGRFEIRARISAARVKGLQSALWLWPVNPDRYGLWPSSGEIDIAEMYSANPDLAVPYVHYYTAGPDPSVTNEGCVVDDLGAFHTYTLEWTSTRIKIAYDGETCLVHRINPSWPLQAPQPFDHPFFVALSQGLGIGDNRFEPGVTPLPATTEVDYVRVYEADGDPPPDEDLEPPETEITSGPDGRTNDTTPTFGFASPSADATAFICRVNGARVPCSGPGNSHTTSALADGDHHFSVAARDAAGNVDQTPEIRWFTVDTVAPETTVSGPSGQISDSTPTFEFSSPSPDANAAICRVDGAVVPCSGPGPAHTTTPLPDGPHTFSVAARDVAGNLDPTPATRSFSVDATNPETTANGPSGRIADSTPTFEFSSPSADTTRFVCGLDGQVVPCSGPGNSHTTAPLADGDHVFAVAAMDAVGNFDHSFEIRWFTVDTVAPETTVSGPSGQISDSTPTFEFSSPSPDANAAICRVDGAVVPCSGPGPAHTTTPLPDGPHTFSVAARDVAGNLDPTPATRSFSVGAVG